MVPINRGHAEVSVPYKQQHRCHRQAQKNTELFAFGAGAIGTRVLHVRALIMGRMERVMEAHSMRRLRTSSQEPPLEGVSVMMEATTASVAEAKDTYEKAKAVTEKATNQLKQAYTTAAKGATDYNLKVIEIARANTYTAVDNAFELLGAKSPTEFVELSTKHARKQFEAMAAQTKELTELAQKVATEITVKDWRHGDSISQGVKSI
jgi:phasin